MRALSIASLLFCGCATTLSNSPGGPADDVAPQVVTESTAADVGYRAPPARANVGYPAAPPPTSTAVGLRAQPAPALSPPPARSDGLRSEAPRSVERPGLATSWGETRSSRVHEVSFERADEEQPSATASIFYNDRTGTEAMASYELRRAARVDEPVAVRGGLAIALVDESGAPLAALSVGGRIHVVGEAGRSYSVVVENHTPLRYEAVISVDGLDVLDGKAASLRKRGYIIEPFGKLVVDGFRKSLYEVAAFRFGSVGASYAARTGSDRNVGVIGLAFFGERGATPWSDDEIERRRAAEPFIEGRFAAPPVD
jgi:hypothetical protein